MKNFNPGEEAIGPLEYGRKRYQEKDYTGAIEAFTNVVDQSTGNILLTALDHRAATYEKLGQLQPALRDSKKMIDEKPERAKGYLRCAKVLQLKGEKDLALKIYERGLTKVKFGTDSERNLLQSMFNKLHRAQDSGKTLDPLQYLPLELAELVVRNLEMRDRVICLRVSKPWKRLLESSHKLWTTLDTSSTRKPISQNALKVYLRRSNYTLDNATINSRAQFDDKKWTYLMKTCKSLTHLKVNGAGLIGNSLTTALPLASSLTSIIVSANCEISLSAIITVLQCCQKTLVDAKFLSVVGFSGQGHWPMMLASLQSLDLRTRHPMAMPLDIVNVLPNVVSLTLVGWLVGPLLIDFSPCRFLETIGIIDSDIRRLPIIPPTIRHMDFDKNTWLETIRDVDATKECHFPLLETFACTGSGLSGEQLREITGASIEAGNLKKLYVGARLNGPFNRPAAEDYPASDTVEELSLAGSPHRDKYVIDVVNLYSNLRRLDVSYTKITGVAVKHFVGMGVKWLKLNECPEISPDAVEYARSKDVEVEFNFPSRRRTVIGYRDRLATAF